MCFVQKTFKSIDTKVFGLSLPIWKFQFSTCSVMLFFETLACPLEFSLQFVGVDVVILWNCTIKVVGV